MIIELERSYIGTLRTPNNCHAALIRKLRDVKSKLPLNVAVDIHGECYASRVSSNLERMLHDGTLELIGVYTKDVSDSVLWDDLMETAKETCR